MKKHTNILLALSVLPLLVQPLIANKVTFESKNLSLKNLKLQETPNGVVITLPNDTKVVNPDGGPPYCLIGCDIAEDCRGNKKNITLKPGMKWACDNKPGACIGVCYPTEKKGR